MGTEGRTKERGASHKIMIKEDILELRVEHFETSSKRGEEAKVYGEKGQSRPLLRSPGLHKKSGITSEYAWDCIKKTGIANVGSAV